MLFLPYALPTYFTIGGGILGTFDRGDETRLSITTDTPPRLAATTTAIRGGGIAPLAQASAALSLARALVRLRARRAPPEVFDPPRSHRALVLTRARDLLGVRAPDDERRSKRRERRPSRSSPPR